MFTKAKTAEMPAMQPDNRIRRSFGSRSQSAEAEAEAKWKFRGRSEGTVTTRRGWTWDCSWIALRLEMRAKTTRSNGTTTH